jgi:hypothetical protein
MTIGRSLAEPIAIHKLPEAQALERLQAIMARLGLPADVTGKFPHQISGGQARRVGVARALVMQPEVIIADEPTAGLDVSVQGELLNLMQHQTPVHTQMLSHSQIQPPSSSQSATLTHQTLNTVTQPRQHDRRNWPLQPLQLLQPQHGRVSFLKEPTNSALATIPVRLTDLQIPSRNHVNETILRALRRLSKTFLFQDCQQLLH